MSDEPRQQRSFFALIEDADEPPWRGGGWPRDWMIVDAIAEDHVDDALRKQDRGKPWHAPSWDVLVLRCRYKALISRPGLALDDRSVWYRITVVPRPSAEDIEAEVVLLGDSEGQLPSVGIRSIERAPAFRAKELTAWALLQGEPRAAASSIIGVLDWALREAGEIAVAVYDVGQGNCNAIVDDQEHPLVFFDYGWPPNFHAGTRPPARPDFGACEQWVRAPIVLSHWDMDHWACAVRKSTYDERNISSQATWNDDALKRFWIARAPRIAQHQLGPMHRKLYETLREQSSLGMAAMLVWPEAAQRLYFSRGYIEACAPADGTDGDRNNSGLAMFVEDREGHQILLPGDADFGSIGSLAYKRGWRSRLVGLVASHHGGRIDPKALPRPQLWAASRLAYSVGNGNRYEHPKDEAMAGYRARGWMADGWTSTRSACPHGRADHKHGNRVLLFPRSAPPFCRCDCAVDGRLCLSWTTGGTKETEPNEAQRQATAATVAAGGA